MRRIGNGIVHVCDVKDAERPWNRIELKKDRPTYGIKVGSTPGVICAIPRYVWERSSTGCAMCCIVTIAHD